MREVRMRPSLLQRGAKGEVRTKEEKAQIKQQFLEPIVRRAAEEITDVIKSIESVSVVVEGAERAAVGARKSELAGTKSVRFSRCSSKSSNSSKR